MAKMTTHVPAFETKVYLQKYHPDSLSFFEGLERKFGSGVYVMYSRRLGQTKHKKLHFLYAGQDIATWDCINKSECSLEFTNFAGEE